MTHVIVEPGVCGLAADIKVEMVDRQHATIKLETDCKMIADLVAGLDNPVDAYALLGMSRGADPLLEAGRAGTRIHAACPTVAGIAKAVEAAAQLALPRDASIRFVED